jgi:hypothetical protein
MLRTNVNSQGRVHQDHLPAPTMWMTMRIINTLVLNLKSMVHMVPNATMANNKAIMNILNNLKNNHNMVQPIW